MKVKTLEQQHPKHRGETWRDYWALYSGGADFKARIKRFLRRNPQEPSESYHDRCEEASYRGYLGTVVDYFAALLFSVPVLHKATVGTSKTEIDTPQWVEEFVDDTDGQGADLVELLRRAFVQATVKRVAYWVVDYPENYGSAATKADAERAGDLDTKVREVNREDVIDWRHDSRGKLEWLIVRSEDTPRLTPEDSRDTTVHTWDVIDRESIRRFEIVLTRNERLDPEQDIALVSEIRHGLGEVPAVELDVTEGLWIGNRLASPQVEHFRLSAANTWSMRRTAYAMPVFNVLDPDSFGANRMGAGYFLKLGLEEKASWIAPPTGHFGAVSGQVKDQKDEIFRLVTQMSLGVDNNAAAVGRSGESKLADAESLQVVLRSYAGKIRDALKALLTLLSRSRGEDVDWQIEGLDKFETMSPDVLIDLLKTSLEVGIPSETFKLEAKYRAAIALLPGIDSSTKEIIRDEIAAGIADEDDYDDDLLEIARGVGAGTQRGSEKDRRDRGADSSSAEEGAES